MSKRIFWIDNVKGLAILLVIVGHVLPDGIIHKMIYSFHMPLFFIISGMFLIKDSRSENLMDFVKKKFWRLYVPMVLFSYLILLPFDFVWCNYIVNLSNINDELFRRALGIIPALRNDWPINGYLWFLPCLFVGSIVVKYIWINFQKYFYVLCGLLFGIGIIWNEAIHHSLPLSIDAMLLSIPFLAVGVYISRTTLRFEYKYLVIAVVLFGLAIWLNQVSPAMYIGRYGSYSLFLVSGLTGSYICMMLCYKLRHIRLLQLGGENTLAIYALHTCFLPFIEYGLKYISQSPILITIYSFVVSIIAMAVLIPICQYINKYAPIMVGSDKRKLVTNLKYNGYR